MTDCLPASSENTQAGAGGDPVACGESLDETPRPSLFCVTRPQRTISFPGPQLCRGSADCGGRHGECTKRPRQGSTRIQELGLPLFTAALPSALRTGRSPITRRPPARLLLATATVHLNKRRSELLSPQRMDPRRWGGDLTDVRGRVDRMLCYDDLPGGSLLLPLLSPCGRMCSVRCLRRGAGAIERNERLLFTKDACSPAQAARGRCGGGPPAGGGLQGTLSSALLWTPPGAALSGPHVHT